MAKWLGVVLVLPASLATMAISLAGQSFAGIIPVIGPIMLVRELGWTQTEFNQRMALWLLLGESEPFFLEPWPWTDGVGVKR